MLCDDHQGSLSTARVAWETCTLPKDQGGLSIRDLHYWNRACILRLVWTLFFRSGSIWVAWFREEVLQGSLNNYWTIKQRRSYSWMANKVLKVKEDAYNLIKLRVENGKQCRFWSDNWSPFGSLTSYLHTNMNSRLGIPRDATLSDLFNHGQWIIPPARSENQINVYAHLTTINLTEEEDYYEWEIDGVSSPKFSTGSVYNHMKPQSQVMPWTKIVWFKGGIPRQSFLTWLFVLNRCPTRDRLLSWGLQISPTCLLCNCHPESRDHLYFLCQFSWGIWSTISSRCDFHPTQSWNDTIIALEWISGPKDKKRLTLLSWQCTIYSLWTERNHRFHHQSFKSSDTIIAQIDSLIRNRISSYRDTNSRRASRMLQQWFSTSIRS